jgi:hypothetical protein
VVLSHAEKEGATKILAYCFSWVCKIDNICANLSKYANGCTPREIIMGETPNISEYLDFEFSDWVLYGAMRDSARLNLHAGLEYLTEWDE